MKTTARLSALFNQDNFDIFERMITYISDPNVDSYVERRVNDYTNKNEILFRGVIDVKYIDMTELNKYILSSERAKKQLEDIVRMLSNVLESIDDVLQFEYIAPWFKNQYTDYNLILVDRQTKKKIRFTEMFYDEVFNTTEKEEFGIGVSSTRNFKQIN